MTEHAAPDATPVAAGALLEIEGLNAFYGSAQALEDVSFAMGRESIAIVGRNGMGKTTLCNAIMGISPPRTSGSIRFDGRVIVEGTPAEIRANETVHDLYLGRGYRDE